jgi:hypothetical protein
MPFSGKAWFTAARISPSPVGGNKSEERTHHRWVTLERLPLLSRGSEVLCPARFSNYCGLLLDTTPPSTGAGPTGRDRHLLLDAQRNPIQQGHMQLARFTGKRSLFDS